MSDRNFCDRWGELLTREQSLAVIAEVDRWCRKTGTNYNKLVIVAQVPVSTRHKVRRYEQRLTPRIANRLRETMAKYRHGISRDVYRGIRKPWECEQTELAPAPTRVVRERCWKCEMPVGECVHTRRFEREGEMRRIAI